MKEEFLHYTWKYGLFDQRELHAHSGETIQILDRGIHNTDSGPDFFNTKLRVGGQLWVGNVEIHVRSSDWEKHGHSSDRAYDNVILHVVFENDSAIERKSGEEIPTLELAARIDVQAYAKYLHLHASKDKIPCGKQISEVKVITLQSWLDRILTERLEVKALRIAETLLRNKNNWEETCYQLLARNFGFSVNNDPFEQLARSVPHNVLTKHQHDRFQLEALLYGQGGFLEGKFKDAYPLQLLKEYTYLKRKFGLQPMPSHVWKFLRMRPSNFPVIRISQFAGLLTKAPSFFSRMLEANNADEIRSIFDAPVSEYWETHYVFDVVSEKKKKNLGRSAIDIILVNTIAPLLFVYGKARQEECFVERAFAILENCEGERNAIIDKWKALNMPVASAGQTQALLQLKKEYCDKKRCLDCGIGNALLKT